MLEALLVAVMMTVIAAPFIFVSYKIGSRVGDFINQKLKK